MTESQIEPSNAPVEPPRRSAGRTIARNAVFGFIAQTLVRIFSFLFQIMIVRTLGGEQVGQYGIVLSWTTLFAVLGDLGITQYLAREIARDARKSSELFWDVVLLRGILAVVAAVVTTIGAIWRGYSPEIVLGIALYTLTYFLSAILIPLSSIIYGNERVDITSLFEVIAQVIFIAAGSLFLLAGLNFIWLVIASFLNFPVLIGLSLWVIRRNNFGPPRFSYNPRLWGAIIWAGLPFAFIQLALSLSFHVDTIILSGFVSELHVGWYSIAYGLSMNFVSFTRAFNAAVLPTLARQHANAPETVPPWYYRSVKMMVFLGLPIAIGGMMLAQHAVGFLYEPVNLPAAIAFAIIIWDVPLLMYTAFCGNLTTSIKKERVSMRIYVSLAIFNLVINFILVPRFGIVGSAFATVLTDGFGAMQFYFFFRKTFGQGLGLKYMLRLVFAGVIMGLVIAALVTSLNWILVGVISVLVYFGVVWQTRAFTPDERADIANLFGRLTRRFAMR